MANPSNITVLPPEEIRRRIDLRREQIKHLKTMLRLSASAQQADNLQEIIGGEIPPMAGREVAHA